MPPRSVVVPMTAFVVLSVKLCTVVAARGGVLPEARATCVGLPFLIVTMLPELDKSYNSNLNPPVVLSIE